jgi:FG-GAP-like repeat/FG-GAP repeat
MALGIALAASGLIAPSAQSAARGSAGASPAVSFAAKGTYQVGGSVAVADLNGDRKPDLATATGSGQASVLLGLGDGRFRAAGHYRVSPESALGRAEGATPALAVGDLNGDGEPDLVVAAHHVSVLLGSNGSFRAAAGYPHQTFVGDQGDNWEAAAVGDLNGDGKADLLVSTQGDGADDGDALLLPGNGRGGFGKGEAVGGPGGALAPSAVAVGDLNGDGRLDYVIGSVDGVSVLLGRGGGRFQFAGGYGGSSSFLSPALAIGDLNGDHRPDIVAVASGTVTILLGKGNGRFTSHRERAAGVTVAIGDLNGDGKPDLALGVAGGVKVLLGDGKGGFRPAGTFHVASGDPASLAIADLNGDGKPDLVVGTARQKSGRVSVLLNTTRLTARK